MDNLASLIETLLWVGLIVWIVTKYGSSIGAILDALQKRIESGGSVKAGPFELGKNLKPQPLQEQKAKAVLESQELIVDEPTSVGFKESISSALTKYYEAEDLALRAVQAEFGVNINRQVTAGADMGFDGTFAKDGTLYIIEVKTVSRLRSGFLRDAINKLSSTVARYGWKNVRIIVVVVTDLEIIKVEEFVKQELKDRLYHTELRVYHFDKLRQQFGITEDKND